MLSAEFIFENLTKLYSISSNTDLCIYEPAKSLYIVKKISTDKVEVFKNIMVHDCPSLQKIEYVSSDSIMMKYISGTALDDILTKEKRLPKEKAIKYITDICHGLTVLHDNSIVHRDINPKNIIITEDDRAVIIDFGISREYQTKKSKDTVIMGTPGYAAPEQFGFSQSDNRTDIYAVGVLLNLMLTGSFPDKCRADGKLGKIIEKCIMIDADDRYRNIEKLLDDLPVKYNAGNKRNIDSYIDNIPGIRSKNPVVVVLSVIWYLLVVIMTAGIICSIVDGTNRFTVAVPIAWVLIFIVPYFSFFNLFDIWNKLPISNGATQKSQKKFYRILGALSIFFGIVMFGFF